MQEAFDLRQEVTKIKSQMQEHQKGQQELGIRYNRLAQIFDEYMKASDDSVEINKFVFEKYVKNSRTYETKNTSL